MNLIMAPLEFELQEFQKPKKLKSFKDAQESVDMVFGIIEEYTKLKKFLP